MAKHCRVSLRLNVSALLGASVLGSLYTLPIDNIRTRMMNQHVDPSKNRINYANSWEAGLKAIKYEGLNSLMVGMYPYFIKVFLYMATVRSTDPDSLHH